MRCHPKAIAYVAHAHTLCDARTKQPGNAPAQAADRGRYLQVVIPAKAGIQGLGPSFDRLRACPGLDPGTNGLSVYLPL